MKQLLEFAHVGNVLIFLQIGELPAFMYMQDKFDCLFPGCHLHESQLPLRVELLSVKVGPRLG